MKFSRRKAILASTLAIAVRETGLHAQEIETVNVKIGGILTLTGPAALWHALQGKAKLVYFNNFNKNGGITYTGPDGKKKRFLVDFRYEDIAYDAKKAAIAYSRLKDWGAKLIIEDGSTPAAALVSPAARDKFPVIEYNGVHPDPVEYKRDLNSQYVLPSSAVDNDATQALLHVYKKNVWDKKYPSESRLVKVGVIAFDSPQRRLYKDKRVKDDYKKVGCDLVDVAIVPITATDVSIELRRMRDAGIELIVIDHTIAGAKVVLEDAQRLGIKDKTDFILWFVELNQILEDPGLFKGTYNASLVPQYWSDDRTPKMEEAAKKYLADDPAYWNERVELAMITEHTAGFTVALIKSLLEEFGLDGMTGERIRAKMFGKTVVDSGVYPKFTIDPKFPVTMPYAYLYGIDINNRRYVRLGKPAAPGPSIYVPEWSSGDNPDLVDTRYY